MTFLLASLARTFSAMDVDIVAVEQCTSPVPSIGSTVVLMGGGTWMYQVDVYLRVRRAVMVDGMSIREVSTGCSGCSRDTVRKASGANLPL